MDHLRYPSFRARPPAGAAPQGFFSSFSIPWNAACGNKKALISPSLCAIIGAHATGQAEIFSVCPVRFIHLQVPDAVTPGGEES